MARYNTGTVSIVTNSTTLTGSGTAWTTSVAAGWFISINTDSHWYQVSSVNSDTSITLCTTFSGTTGSGYVYDAESNLPSSMSVVSGLRSGAGAPNSSIGNISDFYFDYTNNLLYGPKISSGWNGGVPIGVTSISSNQISDSTVVGRTLLTATSAAAQVTALGTIPSSNISFTQNGTGAITRTLQNKATDTISVIDFGATGNTIYLSGSGLAGVPISMTSGSNVLTVTGGIFTPSDVTVPAKFIAIPGAGAGGSVLYTNIIGYISPTQVTVATNASTTLTSVLHGIQYGNDDTAAIQAAIVAATNVNTGMGGIVYFPPGCYTISSTVTLYSNVILQGSGAWATTLREMPGASFIMLESLNFATLNGTNSSAGISKFGFRDLGIDGNKNFCTGTATGVAIFGYDFHMNNVEIYDFTGVCLYSDWGGVGGLANSFPAYDQIESRFVNLRVWGSQTSNGISWNGPSDSLFVNLLVYSNAVNGAVFSGNSGGVMLNNFHAYGNGSYGLSITTLVFGSVIESESNTGGGGIIISSGGALSASTVSCWGNTGDGISINNVAPGSVITNLGCWSNTGDGVAIFGPDNTFNSIVSYSNGGTGIKSNSVATQTVITGASVYSNGNSGIYAAANDMIFTGINSRNNTGNGFGITGGITGLRFDGKLSVNTTTQLSLSTGPASGCIIDAILYATGTQTAYTGTLGNSFYRITSTNGSAVVNQSEV